MDSTGISTFQTPILFLIFNRPETTVIVFEAIKKVKPAYLYIAADGPRETKPGESERCEQTRNLVIDQIDWPCEVKTLFRDENLGCGKAVSSAISWFFENVEEGIILEDDCLPNQSFFRFCEELLLKYRDDKRVWQISGDNFQQGIIRGDGDYYFSQYNHIWGWATWANRWREYSFEMKNYTSQDKHLLISNIFAKKSRQKYWKNIFDLVSNGIIDTWDYQWTFTIFSNNGLTVIPNKNLVSNIGFGFDATHTSNLDSKHSELATTDLSFPIKHPSFIINEKQADEFIAKRIFSKENILVRIFKKVKKLTIGQR